MDYTDRKFIIATDYIEADGKTVVASAIQKLIDDNPNRTLYFPDGIYLIDRPILTPAHPCKSVDLQLSNFACFKASDNWNSDEAMIRLGAKDFANDITMPGSNYGINGGIIDGAGLAKALSIDGGRETYVRNVNIKNALLGLHIKYGANAGSSDADINTVNIVGNGSTESIGVLLDGYDNTLTNMRIANVFTGVVINSGGNVLRSIHPLFYVNNDTSDDYDKSVGFSVGHPTNWFDYCYSDQFAVGFDTCGGGIYKNCFCWWYSDKEPLHVAFRSKEAFFGNIDMLTIGGKHHPEHTNRFMEWDNISENSMIKNVVLVGEEGVPQIIKV